MIRTIERVSPVRVSDDRADTGGYDVHIERGGLRRLDVLVRGVADAAAYAVIADDRVAALHAAPVVESLARRAPTQLLTFATGETSKSRVTWATLTDALLASGMGRDGCIVALGGGVACDLAGFVAATYLRGIPLVQVPTSLLAMIDASIGGKTAVDAPAGKNLVGAFHAPRVVVIDSEVLDTLPDAQLRAGLAEAVKHAAIADADYLDRLPALADTLLARTADALDDVIGRSIEIKAAVVSEDPRETGRRAILNFGHTIAHAIETTSEYGIPHGFAVATGMVVEARIGEEAGVSEPGTAATLARILAALGLPTAVPQGLPPLALVDATRTDKKARVAQVRYALLQRPGRPAVTAAGEWTHVVPDDVVLRALAAANSGRDLA
jgi:3-dehydroquinate synthase